MSMRILGCCALAAAALTLGVSSADADIYTWVDKKGVTNVSNLPPPEGARVTNVDRTPPRDAAREAAAREATRQAELRALNDRVQQLTDQVEQQRREPVAFAYAPPPMPYAPPAPAYVVNVMQPAAPSYGGASGCDYTWGDCGFGVWPGYYGTTVVVGRGKNFRRAGMSNPWGNQIVPPLRPPQAPRMPPPQAPRMPPPHHH
jgi:Domain of unknown function (DUF4124)